jgi:hypothetical protein
VPTIGANGYLVRREALEQVALDNYFFDVDFAYDLVQLGLDTIALVAVPIRHYFSDGVSGFYLKTRRPVETSISSQAWGCQVTRGRAARRAE